MALTSMVVIARLQSSVTTSRDANRYNIGGKSMRTNKALDDFNSKSFEQVLLAVSTSLLKRIKCCNGAAK